MIKVYGMFDDAPLANLGIPIIKGHGPEHPGVSIVEVVGASDGAILDVLREQGCTIEETEPVEVIAPIITIPDSLESRVVYTPEIIVPPPPEEKDEKEGKEKKTLRLTFYLGLSAGIFLLETVHLLTVVAR